MKKYLRDLDLNTDQISFTTSLINRFGCGQHPYCYDKTFGDFSISYVKKLANKKTIADKITEDGIRLLNELKITLSNS